MPCTLPLPEQQSATATISQKSDSTKGCEVKKLSGQTLAQQTVSLAPAIAFESSNYADECCSQTLRRWAGGGQCLLRDWSQ